MADEKQHVLITGTTSGIGRSLMEYYARRGTRVTAVNRREDAALAAQFPSVRFVHTDVRDAQAVQKMIEGMAAAKDISDIFILNAGVNPTDNDEFLDMKLFREAIETNLFGVLNIAAPLTALKAWPRKIRLVAVSSATNYVANPYCLGYYVSKIAVSRSFEALRAMYQKTNLQFKWVVLGPSPTGINPNAEKMPAPVVKIKELFSIPVEKVVLAIAKFAQTDRGELIFPLRAFFLFQGVRVLQSVIPGLIRGQKTLAGRPRH